MSERKLLPTLTLQTQNWRYIRKKLFIYPSLFEKNNYTPNTN